jgi:hypothetical protein
MRSLLAIILAGTVVMPAYSDEGMWLLNDPPRGRLKEKYVLVPVCPEQLGGMATPRTRETLCRGTGAHTHFPCGVFVSCCLCVFVVMREGNSHIFTDRM